MLTQQAHPSTYEKQLRSDSSSQKQLNGHNINISDQQPNKELPNQYQQNGIQSNQYSSNQQPSSYQQQQQSSQIGQSSGTTSQRLNGNTPNNGGGSNAANNPNNQFFKNSESQTNLLANQASSNQGSGQVNGNNYKVVKTFQKGGHGSGSVTNFSSQNTTQSSRKKGSINYQQSNSQSQQQMAAAQEAAQIREQCIFCQKFSAYHSFGPLLNKALYSKYSSSQNYFYSKDINDILGNASTQIVIRFRDVETFDEEEEFLKRFYQKNQQPMKMKDLTEYYKYHKDIPRLFMVSIGNVMNRYHDKRRRIEYQRIKKQLNFETSNNNNTDESQQNTEEEDSQGNKTSKKKEIPKECSNMLQELDVTLSFHQRMDLKMKSKSSGSSDGVNNSHIQAQYNGMNAFYMNKQPNKIYAQSQNRRQSHLFDMSSMMKKASNKNFFAAQAATGSSDKNIFKPQIQYNYYNPGNIDNQNETSYQLSKILQSFQQNGAEKFFYSTEMSMSNLNSILHTQTNDMSTLSNIIVPSSKNIQLQQSQQQSASSSSSSRIQLNYNNIASTKLIPTLNFTKIKNPSVEQQPLNDQYVSNNKQKADSGNTAQKQYQNPQNQQSSSSGSSNYTGNSQQMLHPFQEIHANLPSQKLSNIILEQQSKMQKAILNNGMQMSSNNFDSTQKQSINQLPSSQKLQQNISSSQSSSNSLAKQNQLNLNFNKQTSTGSSNPNALGKESVALVDKQPSSNTSQQQKQILSAKQIMKVLTQNQQNNNNTAANTPAATVTTSPQSSLVEKDAKQILQQNQQILEQLKVIPSNNSSQNNSSVNQNNNNNNGTTTNVGSSRNNSNQSISQKILQKRASDNIYSSASINPIISYSTRIPSTQKNSSLVGAANQLPFSNFNSSQSNNNNSGNNSNSLMKKIEIETGKQQQSSQIEKRYQTSERERIFSERKEHSDKFGLHLNHTNNLKQSEKSSPTYKHPQNLLSTQPIQNQIMQIMSSRQSKEQIYSQKQQMDLLQFKQTTTPASAANQNRPRSSLHQNSTTTSSVAASASKQHIGKSQSITSNPLFQTLRQNNALGLQNANISNNAIQSQINSKCESIPSSNALNFQPNQQQSQLFSNTIQYLTSQNSQNNLQLSQFQGANDGSSSPQMIFSAQQSQLLLNDLQSHYHYSSPGSNNPEKQLMSNNNNGDLRIKKRKEGQASLSNTKGNSITGVSGLGQNNSNINFSQMSQMNQPNISIQSPQLLQQQSQSQLSSQRNHLKSQNTSSKKKLSQHQAPSLDLQQQIQGQIISNQGVGQVPSSVSSSLQNSQSNFFNQKRNSQITSLNPDLIKTQFYKSSSNFNNNQSQKNRSSSNPKQTKLSGNYNTNNNNNNNNNNNMNNLNSHLHAPKNQNFILQYDANFSNPINNVQQTNSQLAQQGNTQQHQHHQQISHLQQQQTLLQQQQQLGLAKHQKSNSTISNVANLYNKQSSLSTHSNFNPSSTTNQQNVLSNSALNQHPINSLQISQAVNGLNSQTGSTKQLNINNPMNNIGANVSQNQQQQQSNFTQINLQLIKNYNSGNTNIINQNAQNISELSTNLNIGTPVYQQANQGASHSRTRSQEIITNQLNIVGSNTTRNHNEITNNAANNQVNSGVGAHYNHGNNNLPGGVSQINQIYEHKYHYNQPQTVRNKVERTASTHFSDSIKRLIEQNTISSSSTTTNRTGSMISAQQFISSKQKSQIQSNQNLTNNSSKYYNQNLTNSPVSIRKNIINNCANPNTNSNNNNNANTNQTNLKKQNRVDTFAARVSNMINIFDPNQQNSQQMLHNLHNNSGGGNANINQSNTITIQPSQHQNNHTNSQMSLHQNGMQNLNIQTNQSNSNYPPSARINLNIKGSTNNSQSRNNSPIKQKPGVGGEMNPQQNLVIMNPSNQLHNPGNLQLNYQVPQNFLPSSIQQSSSSNLQQQTSNTSRNASTQRGTTKTSQLIRYRQNNQ